MRTTIFTVLVVLLLSAALAVAQSPISGAGTANQVAKFTAAHTIGNSAISEVSGSVGIGTTAPGFTLDVNGGINSAMGFSLGGLPFAFGSYQLLNTFLGFAGNSTVTGEENIGIGPEALEESTSGSGNLAMGFTTLYNDTDGVNNLALGTAALYWNQHGGSNVSIGGYSSYFTTGSLNVALGMNALNQNTTGSDNVAVGTYANGGNATGSSNTAIGQESGVTNQNYYPGGSHNTALGDWASFGNPSTPVNNATAIGSHALATQSNSLVLGGTGTYAVNVGIGTSTPATILQIGQGLGAALSDGWQT